MAASGYKVTSTAFIVDKQLACATALLLPNSDWRTKAWVKYRTPLLNWVTTDPDYSGCC
ncbi:hypothetical protein [Actinopolymorpha pittospori]|uniref:Uncharacterized protein n=2 Tax=Actinopolymorpha pittospori TaxID=648752 RepID=A0A927MPV4_9ACTN|nr:hypothetical protein [Actinopolymorpha pittospori]